MRVPTGSLCRSCSPHSHSHSPPPSRYYPFKPPIKPESPLGKLLDAKGVKYYSTTAGRRPLAGGRGGLGGRPVIAGSRLAGRRSFSAVPSTMQAAVVRETGDASVLKVEDDYPVPSVADGQVLVKNEYAGINFIDTCVSLFLLNPCRKPPPHPTPPLPSPPPRYHRSGMYARELPFVGGQEGGGTIAQTTPKAEAMGLKVGDRVAYSVLQTYCEYSAVPAAKILPVPDSVPLDVATSCVVQGLTAHYLTTSAHAGLIQPGEWCLIHGTGGGTCQWAAQMAKIQGYKVIGTAAKGKADVARATGVDELILLDEMPGTSYEDYDSVDVVKKVMEITGGKGAKCVIDGIGLATTDISIDSLAQRGIFVSFGNASGAVPPVAPLRFITKSAFLTRPKLLDYTRDRPELLQRADDIFTWIAEGRLNINVDTVFPLADGPAGHTYLEAGKSSGKVLYKV